MQNLIYTTQIRDITSNAALNIWLANNIATSVNGTLVLATSNVNYNNTSSINVSVTANGTTQVNVAFSVNTSVGRPLSSVSAAVANYANNYAPAGYTAGVTTRLILTPASGGSTISGLGAAPDGWTVTIVNPSATDTLTFAHLSSNSTSANQFSCPQATIAILPPLTNETIQYCISNWIFI